MKKPSAIIFALLLALVTPGLIYAAPAAAPAVPEVVTKGFEAYKKSSADAINAWYVGSPMEKNSEARLTFGNNLANFEKGYGKYLGWELVKVVPITASTEIVYAVIKYEKGPIWVAFDCYKAADQWVLPSIRLQTNAQGLLPPSLLGGQ